MSEQVGQEEGKSKTIWLNNFILNTAAEFMAGVGYQLLVVNNLDPVVTIMPAPKEVKDKWFRGWNQYAHEADSTAFTVGRIAGGVLGIAQGIWEMASGVAIGTGGTLVSCAMGVLCLEGGAASVGAGTALAAHGAVVTAVSSYQTGLQIQALMTSNDQNNVGGGRPSNNIAQNRQFAGAVQEIENQIGRKLTKNEIRQLHDSIHHLENPGYWDIVEEGLNLFGE